MMQPSQMDILKEYGMDVDSTIARFGGNEPLMVRFLVGFPNDKTMQSLHDAVAANDREAMKIAAHSLKGLTGNLGLTPLFEACTKLMDTLRQPTESDVTALYGAVCAEYDRALEMLLTLG